LHFARSGASAVLLANGKVLIAGGGPLQSELYDPATGTWSVDASLAFAHNGGTMALLPNGDVLMAGGGTGTQGTMTEIYEQSSLRAIAWAKSQFGSSAWNGLCERFVENAFGTQGQYATAQAAYNALHTSTNWSPNIGSLVWFVPNASNGEAGHVGIYIGNGQFISATDNGVQIYDLTYWNSNIASYEGWGDAPANWPGR
jgi:NlpC/P60 family